MILIGKKAVLAELRRVAAAHEKPYQVRTFVGVNPIHTSANGFDVLYREWREI